MSRHAAFVLLAPCSHALASASAGIPPPAVAVSACHPHRCCPVVLALAVVVADLLGVVVVVFAAALSLALHGTTCQGWQQSAVQVDQADHVTRSTSIAPFAVFTWPPQDCSSFTLRVTGADTGLRRPQGGSKTLSEFDSVMTPFLVTLTVSCFTPLI